MVKTVDLLRHTDADQDVLSDQGVQAALDAGSRLHDDYTVVLTSGAQRATQTAACLIAAAGKRVTHGVRVDVRFRSEVEEQWKAAYERAGAGDVASFEKADPDLVAKESRLLGDALSDIFASLEDGEKALVVGHSPMQEVAVYGISGEIVVSLAKGAGIRVVQTEGGYEVGSLP